MSNDNGSTPDDNADAAGEVLTEIGGAPPENGGATSATATASSISETARVLLASPPTRPERQGSDFFTLAGGGTAHGHVIGPFIGSLRCQCRCIASSLQGFPYLLHLRHSLST